MLACGVEGTFHKLTERRAFSCAHCGHHVYPTAGTVFQDTRTPLQVWFYAIYLFVTTRHGVSGKELERTLGVTYKTAWRMGQHIRMLMAKADGFETLKGHVELDEAYDGGYQPGKSGIGTNKTIVFGMVERGGRTVAQVIPDVTKPTLRDIVHQNVERGSAVSTDELRSYRLLKRDGYDHRAVNHSKKQWQKFNYRRGEYHHTNSSDLEALAMPVPGGTFASAKEPSAMGTHPFGRGPSLSFSSGRRISSTGLARAVAVGDG